MVTPKALYFHFRNDADEIVKAERRRLCLSTLLNWPFGNDDLTTPVADYLRARRSRPLDKSEFPFVWFCHLTPLLNDERLEQLIQASSGEGISQRFVVLVSGEPIHNTELIRKCIAAAKTRNFGGFTYLPIGLDGVDKSELKVTLARVRDLFAAQAVSGKLPSFETFEQIIHPASPDIVKGIIDQLVQSTAFDEKRHGQFAAKLLDKIRTSSTMPAALEKDKCEALCEFITYIAEFERCRIRLSHETLNDFQRSLRLVCETKEDPINNSLKNDPRCIQRLMEFVHQKGALPSLYCDSEQLIKSATLIVKSAAIQDVVAMIRGDRLVQGRASESFFRGDAFRGIQDAWSELFSALSKFPEYSGKDDENWLANLRIDILQAAMVHAGRYQESLARKNLYKDMQ